MKIVTYIIYHRLATFVPAKHDTTSGHPDWFHRYDTWKSQSATTPHQFLQGHTQDRKLGFGSTTPVFGLTLLCWAFQLPLKCEATTMEITDISITMGATKSLGNYESAKAQVTVTGSLNPDDHRRPEMAFYDLRETCQEQLTETLKATIREMRPELAETKPKLDKPKPKFEPTPLEVPKEKRMSKKEFQKELESIRKGTDSSSKRKEANRKFREKIAKEDEANK